MGAKTSIEWTDASWTPIRARAWERSGDGVVKERIGWHCEKVSAGCKNCYAEPINRRLGTGLDYKPSHLMRADVSIFLDEKMLLAPLRWQKPRRIFVCSMTDLFADFVTDEMIDRVFALMALCPQHTFQVLTKRPERMRAYLSAAGVADRILDLAAILLRRRFGVPEDVPTERLEKLDPRPWPLPHVWLGVSAEDQEAADARVPVLLATPAAVRFLSCEPLLGPIDLRAWLSDEDGCESCDDGEGWGARCGRSDIPRDEQCPRNYAVFTYDEHGPYEPDGCPAAITERRIVLDWVICGGESGPGARPMHPDWARGLRDQCAAAGVAFHFKQWGEFAPGEIAGDYLDPDKPAKGLSFFNETWSEAWSMPDGLCDDEPDVYRIGKTRAGRLLDGVQHDGVPA